MTDHHTSARDTESNTVNLEDLNVPPVRRPLIDESIRRLTSGFSRKRPLSFHYSSQDSKLIPVFPIGKVRLRLLNQEGRPQRSGQVLVAVKNGSKTIDERIITAGTTGYATTEFLEEAREDTGIEVTPIRDGKLIKKEAQQFPADEIHKEGLKIVNLGSVDEALLPGRNIEKDGFISPPDSRDMELAPELFHPNITEHNGTCALDFTASVETRQFYFNQIVRAGEPRLQETYPRKHIISSIPFDWQPEEEEIHYRRRDEASLSERADTQKTVVQPQTPTLGKLNIYRQSWTRVGHGIGQLLYSLALAPCEETKVAMIEWSREERGRRQERTGLQEQIRHELQRDRMIEEIVEGTVDEVQRGHSSTTQGAVGVTGGVASFAEGVLGSLGFSLGGSAATSESFSSGHREISGNTLHSLSDSIVQRSTSMRSLRSMVVTQSAQAEQENIRTRIVRNHNRNHAMTVEYFQVLEHYNVQTDLFQQVDVMMIPYEIPSLLWDNMPGFDAFNYREEMQRLKRDLASAGDQVQLGGTTTIDLPAGATAEFNSADVAADAVNATLPAILSEARTPRQLEDLTWKAGSKAWEAFTSRMEALIVASPINAKPGEVIVKNNGMMEVEDLRLNLFVSQQDMQAEVRRAIENALAGLTSMGTIRQRSPLIAWLNRYATELKHLLPPEHRDGIDALYRLVHTPEIYDTPVITTSRWTVELREGWRPGIVILVHTADGQEVMLQHENDRSGSALATFSSRPVDIQSVEKIELIYAPEKAKTHVIKQVAEQFGIVGDTIEAVWNAFSGPAKEAANDLFEKVKEYKLMRLRVTARTDPTRFLSSSKSFEVLDVRNANITLTGSSPSATFDSVQTPSVDIDITETQRYQDYQ
ncbi:MAG: hypothetical protein R3208_14860 [Ketobacteraceae bacterium]|nr:hypothetical protein [Ketobacteraceae bacterium]